MNKEQTKALATAVVTTLVANLTVKYGMAAVDRLVAEVSNKRRKKPVGFAPAHPSRRLPGRISGVKHRI